MKAFILKTCFAMSIFLLNYYTLGLHKLIAPVNHNYSAITSAASAYPVT